MTANGYDEQLQGFSQRLLQALERRGKKAGATALEREFNLRWRGEPISSHAARKWLKGMSVPTQDKLQVLARWLDVSEEWLRWGADPADVMTTRIDTGPGTPQIAAQNRAAFNQEEASLQQDWRLLEPRNRLVVKSIIDVLLHDQRNLKKNAEKEARAKPGN